jgi:hypothetical protein
MRRIFHSHQSLYIWRMIGVVFLLLAIASCASLPVDRPWVYADLRALDSIVVPEPATDILAVYSRTTDLSVDVRVDLLDINAGDKYHLRLILWDNRDYSQSPLMIDISSTGKVQTSGVCQGKPPIWPRVVQNYWLDTITVSLNRFSIGDRYHLNVSTYATNPIMLEDEVHDVRSDGQPPVNRAPLLAVFWDAFPVTTPAQALRRWDGAHTGPLGDRHGLINILDGAGRYGIPVALLDIKNPASLAALDFMGNVSALKDLYSRSLLILPDVAYGQPADIALDFSRRSAAGFGLPTSQFVYLPSSDSPTPPGYRARFLPSIESTHLGISGATRLIPLPSASAIEATQDGPSLDVRHALIKAAISPDPTDLVTLGGSLPHSTWGDSDKAYPTFEWIAAHPWIQPLTEPDLLTFPARRQPTTTSPATSTSSWLQDLRSAPDNVITQSAWQTYITLTAGATNAQLQALNKAYLGQIGELLEAAKWARNQTPRIDCNADLNRDGHAECVLASQRFFAILEPSGARLTQFFYIDPNGPHQLVGSSSQFTVGLSDPSEWHPELGQAADPSVIPGAFTDSTGTWMDYTPTIKAQEITFTNHDSSQVKTYRLTEMGIQVHYQAHRPVSTRIPLAVDPQAFYFSPTQYWAVRALHSWIWGLSGGSSVEVRTGALLSAESFTSSIPFLSMPEDPNLGYPQGNYLPFPLSVVTIQSDGDFSVEIIER